MNKKLLSMGTILTMMTPIAAILSCGGSSKKIDLGGTVYTATDSFTATIVKGMKDEARKNGLSISMADSANDQSKQNDQIDAAISKGAKVLLINLADLKSGKQVIEKAKNANIPLILWNREADEKDMAGYDKVYFVGPIGSQSGDAQAEVVWAGLNKGIVKDRNADHKLIFKIIGGENGHPDAIARTLHVQSNLLKLINKNGVSHDQFTAAVDASNSSNPNIKVDANHRVYIKKGVDILTLKTIFPQLGINDIQYSGWLQAQGKNIAESLLAGGNKALVDGIFANADPSALGAVEAVKGLGFDKLDNTVDAEVAYSTSDNINYMPIYGVNGGSDVRESIKKGWVTGSVFQDGHSQGVVVIQLAKNIIDGKTGSALYQGIDTNEIKIFDFATNKRALRPQYRPVSRELVRSET